MLVKDKARQDADAARRAHWGALLPVDPFHVAREMGIDVLSTSLGPGISGMLIRDAGSDPQIVLDPEDSKVRQNFTVAHEIGHFVERTRSNPRDAFAFVDYRADTRKDIHEFYADEFAANLLMPAEAVAQHHRDGMRAIELAAVFDVSLPAMRIRLKRLGLSA